MASNARSEPQPKTDDQPPQVRKSKVSSPERDAILAEQTPWGLTTWGWENEFLLVPEEHQLQTPDEMAEWAKEMGVELI